MTRTAGPDALSIRDATVADVPFLVASNVAMARETEQKSLDSGVVERGVAAVFEQSGRGFYLVAERRGAHEGCVLVTFEWSDWRNGDWWWLQSVYTLPDSRRSGVFRALHAEVVRRARATPRVAGLRLYVERDNGRAQRIYQALGMQETHYRLYEAEFSRF